MPARRLSPYNGKAAVERALGFVGITHFPRGEGGAGQPINGRCQRFSNQVFLSGAVGDYDGDGDADAIDGWKKAVKNGRVVHAENIRSYDSIPAAALLYWRNRTYNGYGHAAVSIGRGLMVSTDLPKSGVVGTCPIETCERQWGHVFLGYVTAEGNGYDLGSYNPGDGGDVITPPAGGSGSTPPTPEPPKEEDDMPYTKEELIAMVEAGVDNALGKKPTEDTKWGSIKNHIYGARAKGEETTEKIAYLNQRLGYQQRQNVTISQQVLRTSAQITALSRQLATGDKAGAEAVAQIGRQITDLAAQLEKDVAEQKDEV